VGGKGRQGQAIIVTKLHGQDHLQCPAWRENGVFGCWHGMSQEHLQAVATRQDVLK
jgi:hypothetical protein